MWRVDAVTRGVDFDFFLEPRVLFRGLESDHVGGPTCEVYVNYTDKYNTSTTVFIMETYCIYDGTTTTAAESKRQTLWSI